jgi:hypothetical protein
MAKYAVFFTYSSDAWARMINNPGDRTAAVRRLAMFMLFGAFCERIAIDSHHVLSLPPNVAWVKGAACRSNYLTAHFVLQRRGPAGTGRDRLGPRSGRRHRARIRAGCQGPGRICARRRLHGGESRGCVSQRSRRDPRRIQLPGSGARGDQRSWHRRHRRPRGRRALHRLAALPGSRWSARRGRLHRRADPGRPGESPVDAGDGGRSSIRATCTIQGTR